MSHFLDNSSANFISFFVSPLWNLTFSNNKISPGFSDSLALIARLPIQDSTNLTSIFNASDNLFNKGLREYASLNSPSGLPK